MRKQIEHLQQQAAASQALQNSQAAEQSGITDEERLEAALQQQQLQARIDQLEVGAWPLLQVCTDSVNLLLLSADFWCCRRC